MQNKLLYILLYGFIIFNLIGCTNKTDNQEKEEKIAVGTVIISKNEDSKSSISENDLRIPQKTFDKYYTLFNTVTFEKVKAEYPNAKQLKIESINNTSIIKITYTCEKLLDDSCLSILNKYYSYIDESFDIDGYKISILDQPIIKTEVK